MNYETQIKKIMRGLSKPLSECEKDSLKKSLELIIELRTNLILNYDSLSSGERGKYGFLADQLDRLFTNRYEQTRISTFEDIIKERRKDPQKT